MKIPETKRFIPKGFELGTTLSQPNRSIANNASLIAEQLNVSEEFTCKRQNHNLEPISLPKNCINRFIQQN